MEKNEKIGKKKAIVLVELRYALFFLFCFTFFSFFGGIVLSLPVKIESFYSIILLIFWILVLFLFIVISKQFKKKVVIANIGVCNWIAITLNFRGILGNLIDIKINNLSKEE